MNHSQNILEALRLMPNITVPEIAALVPDMPRVSVSPTVNTLIRAGKAVISGKKDNPEWRGGPKQIQTYALADGFARPVERKPTLVRDDLLAEMRAEIDALKAFQKDALERHPDLATPVHTLNARKIVAEMLADKKLAEAVLAGRRDDSAIMKVALHYEEDRL